MRLILTTLIATLVLATAAAAGPPPKVDVCHVTGSGSIILINVSQNAVPAHLGHGDHLPMAFYADADGDGYGDAETSVTACEAPPAYVADDTDCDDTDAATNPGAEEACGDGVDNDCNGEVDEGCLACPCWTEQELDALSYPWNDNTLCRLDFSSSFGNVTNWDYWTHASTDHEVRVQTRLVSGVPQCIFTDWCSADLCGTEVYVDRFETITAEELAVCEPQVATSGADRGFDCFD